MATTKSKTPAKGSVKKKQVAAVVDPIDVAIKKFEERLCEEDLKLADYLRLLQVRKDRDELRPREITVRWIETRDQESVNEK